MNFVENNGKKVAAVLCVASAFPVVATVVAAQEEPGWHGDKYINEDKTTATGWEEIEGESYYFSEDGTVDTTKTEKATTASVSSNVLGDVKETVATTTTEAVETEKETKAAEEAKAVEEASTVVAVSETTEAATEDTSAPVQTPEEDTTPVVTPEATTEDTSAPAQTQEENTAPVATPEKTTDTTSEDTLAPVETPEQTPAENTETVVVPEETTDAVVTPVTPEETTTDTTTTDTSLNDRIAAAAQQLVGVTDGLQCTQVVQQALAAAGVSDAYQLWPDQYATQYGYYTDTPQAGNLIYYNNGGRGVDHIAIYIGNGLAVHGNYNGRTIIADANGGNSGCVGQAQYIQVNR